VLKSILILFFLVLFWPLEAQIHNPHNLPFIWTTDTSKHTVELADLTMAAQKDELHTLDYPSFIHKSDPKYSFYEYEPVIALTFNGVTKAYPLSILTLYELSNDSIGGKELMITFCPMCNAAVVYNRHIKHDGTDYLLDFGVSGILMHNDMVMYDKQTNSWWEQLMGSGIVGKLSGINLEMMPAYLISVKDYFDRFPEGLILSPDNIHLIVDRKHHRPFHHLDHKTKSLDTAFFIPEKIDPRLPPLERVLDIHVDDHITIYPFSVLAHKEVINEVFDGLHFTIFFHKETVSVMDEDKLSHSHKVGSAVAFRSELNGVNYTFHKSGHYFKDDQTGSLWDITGFCREGTLKGKQLWLMPYSNHFAFAFLAFFPDSKIYGQ
jgi:hypothetical protein